MMKKVTEKDMNIAMQITRLYILTCVNEIPNDADLGEKIRQYIEEIKEKFKEDDENEE